MSERGKGAVKERITQKLERGLAPTFLEVIDVSRSHAGHSGAHPQGESHFRVEVVSAAFAGKGRVERHRLVHSLLAKELSGTVHALALSAKAPDEAV